MTVESEAEVALPAEVLPAHILALAEKTTRFRDRLHTLQFHEPFSAGDALAHAEAAADLSEAVKAVSDKLAKVPLYVSPTVRDTFLRLQLLATQAQLADEHLTWVHVYLDELTAQERAQRPQLPGPVLDTLVEAGRHLREADMLTAFGARDALHAATDFAGALRAQKVNSRVQAMSPAEYAALHATASGYVTVDSLGDEEWAWNRLDRLSMGTVRSLESRDWIFREAHHPVPGSRSVRLHLTEAGRLALASRLGRAPVVTRSRALATQPARTRLR